MYFAWEKWLKAKQKNRQARESNWQRGRNKLAGCEKNRRRKKLRILFEIYKVRPFWGKWRFWENFGPKSILGKQEILKINLLCIEESCREECQRTEAFQEAAKKIKDVSFVSSIKRDMKIDLVVTIGGDGTILWALRLFKNRPLPPLISYDAVEKTLVF